MVELNGNRYVSACCLWEARREFDADGTPAHWVCEKCVKPCNLVEAVKKKDEPTSGEWGEDV